MWVAAESIDRGRCQSCGAPVTWVVNVATGRRQPLDGHAITIRRLDRVADRDGCLVDAAEILLRVPSRPELGGDVSHFATCPQANEWRGA